MVVGDVLSRRPFLSTGSIRLAVDRPDVLPSGELVLEAYLHPSRGAGVRRGLVVLPESDAAVAARQAADPPPCPVLPHTVLQPVVLPDVGGERDGLADDGHRGPAHLAVALSRLREGVETERGDDGGSDESVLAHGAPPCC